MDTELEMTRSFDVPPHQLFEAWTRPEYLEKWIGPDGYKVSCKMDFRKGGNVEIVMRGQDTTDVATGVYDDIVPDKKIAESFRFTDVPDLELKQVITFDQDGEGKTNLTMHQWIPDWDRATEAQKAKMLPRVEGAREGWTQTLEHLARFVTTLGEA
jgi:uncharacterized protein YndB with AHSA1/START domain